MKNKMSKTMPNKMNGYSKGGMAKKMKGYAKGGMVQKANCGASMKPTQRKK